ncbi:androgen-induced gene 1 protein-like isoform X1 [Harmonia axyridis]|uniref:androgen-induced gene 1 protein-like isoform X1 n=1 Tax=Harmonia axyridis TaxID=115357 RepID=UPI001E274E12|nr:androgen-induced gene 1 protein-like isoform X1 [Harmonia axyridis]
MGAMTVVHAVFAVHFWFGCYYDWVHVRIPKNEHMGMAFSFGNTEKLKFLTFWNALLQGLFFTICLLNDIIGTNEPNPKKTPIIRKVKDTLFTALAFPLSIFVGTTFWGIYAVDRELVFPKILDKYFPVWLNHVMHTNIMIFVLIEMAMNFRSYPKRKTGISILGVFMMCYLIWMHVIYHYSGVWVYPIFEVLNLPLRILFFVGLLVLIVVMYLIGEGLNNILWSNQIKAVKSNKAKKRH